MNYKNIALYGLLLLTAQSCFTVDYRTIGRRTFKTLSGAILVPYAVNYGQSTPATVTWVADHEAAHAITGSVLDQGRTIEEARIFYATGIGPIAIDSTRLKILCGGQVFFDGIPSSTDQVTNHLKGQCAGAIQDAKNIEQFKQTNFIENELHLPISKLPIDNNTKFNRFLEGSFYAADRYAAYQDAMELACTQLNNWNDHPQASLLAHKIVRQNFMETIPFIDKHQGSIKAVGKDLAKKGTLTGDEIRKIVYQQDK